LYEFTEDNHQKEFRNYTEELISQNLEVEERIGACNFLLSSYINHIGTRPPEKCLELLANFILRDHLSSRNPDKLSKQIYPFLSDRQQKTRDEKEFAKENSVLDYIKLKKMNNLPGLHKRNKNVNDKGE
jgi:hypothetical protein